MTSQTSNLELFDQWLAVRIQHGQRSYGSIEVEANLLVSQRLGWRHVLAEQDRVIARCTIERQDVGRVVVRRCIADCVSTMTINRVVTGKSARPDREDVYSASAVREIVSSLRINQICARTAPDRVVATTAEQLIVATVAIKRVVSANRRRLVLSRYPAPESLSP